jgi:hypothetical protein
MLWDYYMTGSDFGIYYNVMESDTSGFIVSGFAANTHYYQQSIFDVLDSTGIKVSWSAFINIQPGGGLHPFCLSNDNAVITHRDITPGQHQLMKITRSAYVWQVGIPYSPIVIKALPDSNIIAAENYAGGNNLYYYNSTGSLIGSKNLSIGNIVDIAYVHSNVDSGFCILSADIPDNIPGHIGELIKLTRTDYQGNIIWSHDYECLEPNKIITSIQTSESQLNVITTFDGGFAVAGSSKCFSENSSIIFFKTDSNGNIQ